MKIIKMRERLVQSTGSSNVVGNNFNGTTARTTDGGNRLSQNFKTLVAAQVQATANEWSVDGQRSLQKGSVVTQGSFKKGCVVGQRSLKKRSVVANVGPSGRCRVVDVLNVLNDGLGNSFQDTALGGDFNDALHQLGADNGLQALALVGDDTIERRAGY